MGASKAPTEQQVTTTTSNLPEYAEPYFMNMMGAAQANLNQPYQPYTAQRQADFNPYQLQSQQNVMGMQQPGQMADASNLTATAGLGALGAGQYNPYQFSSQQIGQPNLNQYQMSGVGGVGYQNASAPQTGAAQTGYQANLQNMQMGLPGMVNPSTQQGGSMQAAQSGYSPNLQNIMMGNVGNVSAQQYGSPQMQGGQTSFNPNLQQYQMDQAQQVSGFGVDPNATPQMQGAQSNYNPMLQQFQMQQQKL